MDTILDDYAVATEPERNLIDAMLIYITGWSLPTLIKKAE